MLTAYVLVKHLDAKRGTDVLTGSNFSLTRINQGSSRGHNFRKWADELFPTEDVQFSDFLYRRDSEAPPPSRTDQDTGYGDIAFQSEDLLFALRLLKPGDVSFAAQTIIEADDRKGRQRRYRYFSAITSTHPYYLDPAEIVHVEALIPRLVGPVANTPWFQTARRFFLYGGAKEFKPQPHVAELDRIVDYATALEAVLTYGTGETGAVLRRRACALLGAPPKHAKELSKLLSSFYGFRSAITHGNPPTIHDAQEFHRQMWRFEGAVRDILRNALDQVPALTDARVAFFDGLAAMSDVERLLRIRHTANDLENTDLRKAILNAIPS
jgi:hypothetical protein